MWPVVVTGVVLAMTAIGMEWLAYWFGTGSLGMVIAYMFSNLTTLLFVVLMSFALPSIRELKLFNWSRAAFRNLWEMISLLIKSLLYQFSIRIPREVGTIVIGLLGENVVAAQSILLRLAIIFTYCASGFWIQAVAVMGRAAGAKNSDKFFKLFNATLHIFAVYALLSFIILCALQYPLTYASTSIKSVQVIVMKLMPVMAIYAAIFVLWVGSQTISYAVGRINVTIFAAVFSAFGIGLPLSLSLTFLTSLKLYGFYIGLISSYAVALVIIWTYYACNWSDLIRSDSESNSAAKSGESSPLLSSKSGELEIEKTQSLSDGGDSTRSNATEQLHSSEAGSKIEVVSDLKVLHDSSGVVPNQEIKNETKIICK